ncbi:MAG TPA: hypothetical protein VEY70_06410 [Metabacillus sp.]|nr:hypothetical protein [Metabacillus sp.]
MLFTPVEITVGSTGQRSRLCNTGSLVVSKFKVDGDQAFPGCGQLKPEDTFVGG